MIQETKLPYKLFVGVRPRPLHALSWRLNAGDQQAMPVAWILLIGKYPPKLSKSDRPLNAFGVEVALQLSQTNYGLVTGIDMLDFDISEQSLQAFTAVYKQLISTREIKDYLRYYNVDKEELPGPALSSATTITFRSSEHDLLIQSITSYPNATILIGGHDASYDIAIRCLQNGRPVFPLVESGNAAKRFYDLLLDKYVYDEKGSTETTFGSIKVNLQAIYQHPLDVKALDQPFRSAIAEIISHLNMIYAPDDPRMYAKE